MTQTSPHGSSSDDASLESLLDWVTSQTGLSFRGRRQAAIDILRRATNRFGTVNNEDIRLRLAEDCGAFDDLIGELTIGETYFFREHGQFELIANEFFPQVNQIRPPTHQVRLWSAGCASGEEAWSLAVLLAEAGLAHRGRVLATDISRTSLMRAQLGQYRAWSLRGDTGRRMRTWLSGDEDVYTIVPQLRPLVSFEYLNLAEDTYPSFATNTIGMDLILCRNVLIYFDQATIAVVARRLFQSLSPGGWLITGASDPALHPHAPFEVRSTAIGRIYARPARQQTLAVVAQRPQERAVPPSEVRRPAELVPEAEPDPQPLENHQQLVEQAEQSLRRGHYGQVINLTAGHLNQARLCALRVRAFANLDVEHAETCCQEALAEHRLNTELNYLYTILLTELGRYEEAAAAGKRLVYLDRGLAVGQMALGTIFQRLGDVEAARRAFRSAKRICRSRPSDELVPLADGEQAGRLAESAARHLSLLENKPTRDRASSC